VIEIAPVMILGEHPSMKETMPMKPPRQPLTDEELKNLVARDFIRLKLTDDEKSRLRRISELRNQWIDEFGRKLRIEEEPLLADLRAIGWDPGVDSVWDLVNTAEPYPEAIPILLWHLTRPYSDRIKEGIARALAVPDAVDAWPILVAEYKKAEEGQENGVMRGYKDGLAVALAVIATDAVLGEVISLIKDTSNGSTRIFFLGPLCESKNPLARQTIEELKDDPDLKKEITFLKKKEAMALRKKQRQGA
jgi:hypothetical protein